MNLNDYIKPELLVLIPVLYLLGAGVKKSGIKDKHIPLILGCVGVLLSGVYIFAQAPISTSQEVATAFFTAVTQGVLVAGASVYFNQIYKQERKDD